nr:hypothetical protein [Tanacetum cinerariifolium]
RHRYTESDPEEAPSKAEESHPLGSKVSLMSEEFEASEPSSTRTISSHSSVSSDSTAPLPLDHPLTHRYRSSYETSSSSSSTLPVRKRYRGTFELVLDTDSDGDELGEEDTEEDESLNADDEREGQGLNDEGQGLDDEGQGSEDEGPSIEEEEEAAPEGQHQAVLVVDTVMRQSSRSVPEQERVERVSAYRQSTLVTWVDHEDVMIYTDIPTYVPLATPVQIPPSPEWSLGSLPVSPSSPVVPSPIASPVATPIATISRLDALLHTLFEGYDRGLRELYTRSGVVRDEFFS